MTEAGGGVLLHFWSIFLERLNEPIPRWKDIPVPFKISRRAVMLARFSIPARVRTPVTKRRNVAEPIEEVEPTDPFITLLMSALSMI